MNSTIFISKYEAQIYAIFRFVSGGISNIFNLHYISSVTINAAAGRYYEPAPGRSFFINIRLAYS